MNLATRSTLVRAGLPVALALTATLPLVAHTTRPPQAASSNDRPGDLGLVVSELPRRLPKGFDPDRGGALVVEVFEGGPADRADVREGDIVLEFDNQAITSAAEFQGRVRRLGAGRLASMRVWRNGSIVYTGLMTLAERRSPWRGPDREPDASEPRRIGDLEGRVARLERDVRDLTRRMELLETSNRSGSGR